MPGAARAGTPPPASTAWSVNVLTLRGPRISAITSFIDEVPFIRQGLPLTRP